MTPKKLSASVPVATVIGDVVGSRGFRDRRDLHARLAGRLAELNDLLGAEEPDERGPVLVSPLRVTAGDEYQGTFSTLGAALRATRWLRLSLLPDVDVRHGLGWGPVEVFVEDPRVEDGPGWWAARGAVVAAEEDAARAGHRRRRTAYRLAEGFAGPDPAAVNAALVCRDEMVGGLSDRSLGVLRGLLSGRTQREIAEKLGVSPSAVSQRVRHDGLAALVAAERLLGEIR
jgi:DNA-binding transcriptional LysR family regulator